MQQRRQKPESASSDSHCRQLSSGDGSIDARIVLYDGDTGTQQASLVEASLAERYGADVSPSIAQQSVQQLGSVQQQPTASRASDEYKAATARTRSLQKLFRSALERVTQRARKHGHGKNL